jgi:hypothetical protein
VSETPPTLEQAADLVLRALDALETATKAAIIAELRPLVPAYSLHVKETATAAKAAEQALEKPAAALEVLRAELADAEEKTSLVASGLNTGIFEERAEARYKIEAYERECGRIQEQILNAEQDLLIFTEKRNETRAAAEGAFGGMVALGEALAKPLEHPIAQATDSYRVFRAPQTWMILLAGDQADPEWNQAVKQWLELAKISGLRTEDYKDELPSDAEHFRKFWREYEADPGPAPSGQEIIYGIHAGGISGWINSLNRKTSGGRIEDHRTPRPAVRAEFNYQPLKDIKN